MMRHLILFALLTAAACGSPSKKVDAPVNSLQPDQGPVDMAAELDMGDELDMVVPLDGGPDVGADTDVRDAGTDAAADTGADMGRDMAADTGPDLPPEPLHVVSVIPGDGATDVPVESTITVTFDAVLDPVGLVTLDDATGSVGLSMAVNGSTLVITPDADLREFQTTHTLTIGAGVSGEGRTLPDDFVSTFTTRMFVPDRFYAASNEHHGVGYSLGIDSANQCVMMPADDTAPSQRWRAVPRNNGWIIYNSAPVAVGRALNGGDGTENCAMVPLGPTPMTGQVWEFQNQATTAFVVQNQRFGTGQSLDATNNPPPTGVPPACAAGSACPLMQPSSSINRQFWRWRRLQ